MPKAYGSDRLQVRKEGTLLLFSPFDKGWQARSPRTSTKTETPGTAVLWEDEYYEVLVEEQLDNGRVRYELAPWREDHTIRVADNYDQPTEEKRAAEFGKKAAHREQSKWMLLFGFLAGHLPQRVQRHIESEYGVSSSYLTVSSTIPLFLFGVYAFKKMRIQGIFEDDNLAPALVSLGAYGFAESLVRLRFVLGGNPIGSVAGTLLYHAWAALFGGETTRQITTVHRKGRAAVSQIAPEVAADRLAYDAYHQQSHFLSLLSPAEQYELYDRYGFDYVSRGRASAWFLLVFAGLGGITGLIAIFSGSASPYQFSSAAVALYLVVEQIGRLGKLAEGRPAGSVLGWFTRPAAKKLFGPRLPVPAIETFEEVAPPSEIYDGDEVEDPRKP